MTKAAFLKQAKKKGAKIYKNNIHRAKPLDQICGQLKFKLKTPFSFKELVCC